MIQRLILGKFADGGYGLRVSVAGYDVNTNPVDNEKLIFNSDWAATFSIASEGTFSVVDNSVHSITIPDLGYIPFFFCTAFVTSQSFSTGGIMPNSDAAPVPFCPYLSNANYNPTVFRIAISRTQIVYQYINDQSNLNGGANGYPTTMDIHYKIFRNRVV